MLFLANRGANGIDGLISSGIGAAVASGRPTWIVTGDLGLFHDMNALAALAPRRRPRCGSSCINNDGGGIFEFLPQAGQVERDEFEALLGTPLGHRARAGRRRCTGSPTRRLDDLARARPALAPGTGADRGPDDRAENVALHERLASAAAEAVAAALG